MVMQKSGLAAPFLRRLRLLPERMAAGVHPFNLPLFAGGLEVAFPAPITILVGENGTGKSTLLEAIAAHCGFHAEGGSRDHAYAGGEAGNTLAGALRLSWLPKVANGFFFRAESFFNFASHVDGLRRDWPVMELHYGPRELHRQSRGEAFLALLQHRLGQHRRCLYLLDEPEAALSPARQLEFLAVLDRWHRSGAVQALIATHSPIVMSYPKARLLRIDGGRLHQARFQDTEHFRVMRAFLADPAGFHRRLFAPD